MLKPLRRLIALLNPLRALRRSALALANWRRLRFTKVDYVTLMLPPVMPALPEPRGWLRRRFLGAPPLSLLEVEHIFRRIADDPRPQGIILYLRGFSLSLADLQTLRGSIARLRERGKRVVCYAHHYDMATYYVASAADEIVLQPGGELLTLGLRQQVAFFKDALDAIGIQVDGEAISP